MAISGRIEMEDRHVTFKQDKQGFKSVMRVTIAGFVIDPVTKDVSDIEESYTCDELDFLRALSIGLHPDCEPDVNRDYPAAERAMPKHKDLRFIP